MAKNPQVKDEALEALDFIVNVLKEHESDLDKLINELATVTEQMGDTSELSGKVDKVEEKIGSLQKEVSNLLSCFSGDAKSVPLAAAKEEAPTVNAPMVQGGPTVAVTCSQWEDFRSYAAGAQTVAFNYQEDEKTFHATAVRGNQIVSYEGPLPKFSSVLKLFLSKELRVSDQSIVEGNLAVS
jgi:trans-2-enoyl-CoA reductase